MSIYKEDPKCAHLSRLGAYRQSAISKLENDALNALVESREAAREKIKAIAEKEGKDSWNVFFESIDLNEAQEAISLLHELFVLAAQKSIENHLVRLAKVAFSVPNERDLYKFTKLKDLYRQNAVRLEDVIYFNSINEIRLVGNSIKHGGVVSKELATLPGWTVNQKLWNLQPFYARVKSHIPLFIEHSTALVEEVCGCYVAPSSELREALNA